MSGAVEIRDATDDDVAAITAVYNHVIDESDAIWIDDPLPEADRRAWLARQRAAGMPTLVAEVDGTVVGYSACFAFRDKPGYWPTVEHTILLGPGARGRGIGQRLLDALVDRAVALGKQVMVAGCDGGNEGAIRFHERNGFRRVAEMPAVGRKRGHPVDLVLLQRDLDGPSR
ncbi:MAG TPA: N-acetyltransferase family protein [Aquihabitans sp.]|nr:N-acetyltransferase family protein [Aquihabitans sp.]